MDRKIKASGAHWTANDRVKAVAAYLVLGNMARVSEQLGIPLGTLNFWKSQPWWFEQVDKIRQAEDLEIDNGFTKIVRRTQEIILDRLENGDQVLTKDGELVARPVSARDAALIADISLNKRQVLREVPAAEQNKIGMQERLSKLEMQFTKLVTEKTIDGEVVKIEESGEPWQETTNKNMQMNPESEKINEQPEIVPAG